MWPHVSRFVLRARQRAIQGLKALEEAQAHSKYVGHQMRRLRRKANLLVLLNWLTLENLGVTEGVVHSKTSNSRRWAVSSVESSPSDFVRVGDAQGFSVPVCGETKGLDSRFLPDAGQELASSLDGSLLMRLQFLVSAS